MTASPWRFAHSKSEIVHQPQLCLMALEILEIECAGRIDGDIGARREPEK
jgi:hypothetical protein